VETTAAIIMEGHMRKNLLSPMARIMGAAMVGTLLAGAPTVVAQVSPEVLALLTKDVRGASDHPLIGRYAGSVLLAQTVKAFDELVLPNGPSEGKRFQQTKKFSSTITAQGKVTRSIYVAPPGRSSLEVITNFTDAVVAQGFEPVYRCTGNQCGESFPLLKYRRDKPETMVVGENYEHLRRLLIQAAFDELIDMRYALFKQSAPDGDSYVAIYGGVHRGGHRGAYSKALEDRVGVLVEVVEPRPMERRMEVVQGRGDRPQAHSGG
jgi:hypothetical protein